MTKHKTDDYKNSAVKYYLNNENGDGYNQNLHNPEKDKPFSFYFFIERCGFKSSRV